MTQPGPEQERKKRRRTPPVKRQTPHWITETLKRYDEKDEPYNPVGFDFRREPYDPSSYYRDLGLFKDISASATRRQEIENFNRRERQRQEQLQQLMQAGQGVDLSGVTPQYSGRMRKKGKGYSPPLQNYRISSGYGPRNRPTRGASSNHQGVDMAAPMGTPIYATHSGTVAATNNRSGYGNSITVSAGNGVQTFYGHNQKNVVRPGQQVQKGQLIGYVGSTGVSTGPHLHYGVLVNGQWVNPRGYY